MRKWRRRPGFKRGPARRRYKARRRRVTRRRRALPIGGWPRGRTQPIRLRYAELITFDVSAINVLATKEYCANGLFDPNLSLGGHQPRGFDEWIQIYNEYTVIGSKCCVQAVGGGDGNNKFPANWGICLMDQSGTLASANIQDAIELGLVGSFAASVGSVAAVPDKRLSYRTKSFSLRKFFGAKQNLVRNPDFTGNENRNPTDQAVYTIWCVNCTGTDPPLFTFLLHIDYIVIFSQRRPADPPVS